MTFEEANNTTHKIEDQWHYEILAPLGWKSDDKEKQGFMRSYLYYHESTEITITCTTGCNADYWTDSKGNMGYWRDLEGCAKEYTNENN